MSRTRYTMAFDAHNMVPGPAARSTVQVLWRTEDGVTDCYGTGSAPTTANTYAEGCIYRKFVAAGVSIIYYNYGTYASPDFEALLDVNNVVNQIEAEHLATAADDSGPSPLIWDDAPVLEVTLNPGKGFHVFEDFLYPDVYATGVLNGGLLMTQQSGGGAAAILSTVAGGVLEMDTGTAGADDGPSVQFPGMQVLPAPSTKIYFEARVKVDMDNGDTIIGLGDSASVSNLLGTGTIVTNKDMAVFFRDDGVADAKMGIQTGDGSNVDSADDVLTDVDKTAYETYGIVIDGDGATAGDTVKYYHKGVLVRTDSTLNTIPDKVMCPIFQVQAHTTAQDLMDIDWFRLLVYNSTAGTVRV